MAPVDAAPIATTPTPVATPPAPTAEVPYEAPTAPVLSETEVVNGYLADCNAVFPGRPTPEEMMEVVGDAGNECTFLEVGQNCNPDISGCYNKSIECQSACGSPCKDCQSACGNECDTCKATCGSDATCLRTCAEARATCRTMCLAARDTCRSMGCATVESTCEVEHAAEIVATCGDCQPMESCMEASFERGDYEAAACHAASPGVPEACWTWCNPAF